VPEQNQLRLILELPPDAAFLPAATAAAENAARVFGLESAGALRLSLAVEEFFTYLCRFAGREEPLRLTLSPGGSFVRVAFRFRAGEVSLRALNFAAGVSLEDACGNAAGQDEELGLLVASRTTDRCSLTSSGSGIYVVAAEVDRDYPEVPPIAAPQRLSRPVRLAQTGAQTGAPPSSGQLQHADLLAAGRYPARACPASFFRPARFADMVASGQYQALLAVDAAGHPAGLLCFRASGPRAVTFSGPYVFDDGSDPALGQDIARLLVEGLLSQVARTEALCAFSERPTADVPPGWFERLGSLRLRSGTGGDGEAAPQAALFRHLREDAGGAVWAHADLLPYLEKQYARLAFPRDLLRAEPAPAARLPRHSLLATSLDRRRGLAVLKPLLDGQDFAANLSAHVAALAALEWEDDGAASKGVDILLHLDLSEPWQAAEYPALAACGFAPRLILPHAGASDLLVCQHVPAHR
jgi:hypothetical protein